MRRRRNPQKQLTFPWHRDKYDPKRIKTLPPMTDVEFFWGDPNDVEDERLWFRAFRAMPGKPYQDYFHIYTWRPLNKGSDLKQIVADCVRESIVSKPHGLHGKIVIQCCPDDKWDPESQRCIENRPQDGKRPLFYKVLIPENDLPRLLEAGLARRAQKRVRGITMSTRYFPQRNPLGNIADYYQRNPTSDIAALYQEILPYVPTFRHAINVCLVAGGIRPAALISSDWNITKRQRIDVQSAKLMDVLQRHSYNCRAIGDAVLVFNPQEAALANSLRVMPDGRIHPDDDRAWGRLLGFSCPGDMAGNYNIAFLVARPGGHQFGAIFDQLCNNIDNAKTIKFSQLRETMEAFCQQYGFADQVILEYSERTADEDGNVSFVSYHREPDIRTNPNDEHSCPDCDYLIDDVWRAGVCDECKHLMRSGSDNSECENCDGTGHPRCCRCEGIGVDPEN